MSNSILNIYPVFENNQVLTSSELNELATYLDQQTRLSRTKLVGVGVVCGLEQNYDLVTNKLTISAGTGITTEGYLIETGDCVFTQYRIYTLPPTLPYSPFIDTTTNLQVPLWELLRADYVPMPNEIVQPLNYTFVNGTSAGDQKVVLLFLEMVDVSNDSCLGKSCDSAGLNRTFTLRKLLITVNDLQTVLRNTGPFDLTFIGKFDLPDLLSQRPLFDPNQNNSKDYFAFSQNFRSAAASVYKRNPSDLKDLLPVLRQCYTVFQPILQDTYNNVNPFLDAQIPNLNIWNEIMDGVNSVANGPSYFGIQYFYDFLRDLLLAYNEFRDAAFELMSACCVDTRLFPMHLVLGEAIPVDMDKPSVYRDDFVGIPLTPEQRFAQEELICYFNRMVLMVRMFDINRIHQHNTSALPTTLITPSFEKHGKLSERSIPYYYKIDDVDPQLGKLERFWNFENISRDKKVNGEYPVVAYGNQSSNQTAPIDPIQTPLFYDLDQFNFLRIEGAIAKDYSTVLTNLNNLKNAFDLPFNVVAVRLQGTSSADDILARCEFNDLRSQYVAYRNELYCSLNNLYNQFFLTVEQSSASPFGTVGSSGTSITSSVKPGPTFVRQLLADVLTPTNNGNSSASFLPQNYALPGQSLPRFIPPITYSPIPTNSITSSLSGDYLPQLGSRLLKLIALLPEQLDSFDYGADNTNVDESFINSYIDAVALCNIIKALFNEFNDQITHSTKTKFTPEMYFAYSQWINEQFYFLNEFITDCKFRKLEAVFYELQYRINYLQTNDPTLFSNFITRNPGISHDAGVKLGGTFVLVYPGASLNFSVKVLDQLTAQLAEIKVKEVAVAMLKSKQGKTVAESAQLTTLQGQLCDLYAAQVQQPGRTFTLGSAVTGVAVQQIAIGENDVIADFSLPYLSNCECECDDIPAPTSLQLGIPAIALPAFYEYFLGDYAFVRDFVTNTTGCTSPAQLTIDVHGNINYDAINKQENIVKLQLISNGDTNRNQAVDVLARSTAISVATRRSGTVQIITGTSNYDVFLYTPPKNYLGIDQFDYVFEVYDRNNNILLRSNKASVIISVTPKCSVPVVAGTTDSASSQQSQATA